MINYSVLLAGAGNLGSRHLQALKKVNLPLSIYVVDPSPNSLKLAKQRYDDISRGSFDHPIEFFQALTFPENKKIDLAIIATNSNVRRKVLEDIFAHCACKFIILEKLLFQERDDYLAIDDLFLRSHTKAWVNCSMRAMPFYYKLKEVFNGNIIRYVVSGSQFGLVTNLIHYIDHMIFLTECPDFTVDYDYLDPRPIESKRKGFIELNGNLSVCFKNGSVGVFTCYPEGNLPILVEIISKDARCISREWEKKAWISMNVDNWAWKEINADIPYQSQMTKVLTEEILSNGTCPLVTYSESMGPHLTLLEALKEFLNEKSDFKTECYPFT